MAVVVVGLTVADRCTAVSTVVSLSHRCSSVAVFVSTAMSYVRSLLAPAMPDDDTWLMVHINSRMAIELCLSVEVEDDADDDRMTIDHYCCRRMTMMTMHIDAMTVVAIELSSNSMVLAFVVSAMQTVHSDTLSSSAAVEVAC